MMALIKYSSVVNDKLRTLESRHSDLIFRDAKSRPILFIKSRAATDGNKKHHQLSNISHSVTQIKKLQPGHYLVRKRPVTIILNPLTPVNFCMLRDYDAGRLDLN